MENTDALDRYLSNRALLTMTRTWDALDDLFALHFAKHGLSWPKFNALVQLDLAAGRGLTQSELSSKMLVSRANITGLIERLERDGLVFRKGDRLDKRVFRVHLTDKARRLLHLFMPIHKDYVNRVMSLLDKREKEIFICLLDKLRSGLDSL